MHIHEKSSKRFSKSTRKPRKPRSNWLKTSAESALTDSHIGTFEKVNWERACTPEKLLRQHTAIQVGRWNILVSAICKLLLVPLDRKWCHKSNAPFRIEIYLLFTLLQFDIALSREKKLLLGHSQFQRQELRLASGNFSRFRQTHLKRWSKGIFAILKKQKRAKFLAEQGSSFEFLTAAILVELTPLTKSNNQQPWYLHIPTVGRG